MIENLSRRDYRMGIKQDEFSKLEDDIYKLFVDNVEAKENIELLYQTQSKNLEDIAHQIKTPITAMLFQLENSELEGEPIQGIKHQVQRLNSLTDILLKLASLDSKTGTMKKEKIVLSELVDYALEILDGEIIAYNTNIVKENLESEIIGDYYWLSEGIINILKNAIIHTKEGKVTIVSNANPIYTELIIEDEGGGIAKDDKKKIFRRFYKSPDSKGFGIGLAMAKTIIESNHGEILVQDTAKGSKFVIKFYKVT